LHFIYRLFFWLFLFTEQLLRPICGGLLLDVCGGTSSSHWTMSDELVSGDILKVKIIF
jgi:hypothetical protein